MKKTIFGLFVLVSLGIAPMAQAVTLGAQFESAITKQKLNKNLQSFCVADEDGATIASINSALTVAPASVTKIYTTDWALQKLPTDFRYTTEFIVKDKTLYINGSGDPHFVIEHLDKILHEIYRKKKVKVSKIVFSPNFYFNWKKTPEDIQKSIVASVAERVQIAKADSKTFPVAKNLRVAYAEKPYSGAGSKFEFQSAPLPALLKQMNDYSTNISADVLFKKLGGSEAFATYMKDTYGVDETTIKFENGSGLPVADRSNNNYTTCALTLRVLKHLNETLAEKKVPTDSRDPDSRVGNLEITDILSAPASDPGVLMKRAFDLNLAKAMVAKSGFIFNRSTLAGAIQTTDGLQYFGIFTNYPNLSKTESVKYMVDTFTNSLLKSFGTTLKPFDYEADVTLLDDVKIVRK